jgi:DNA-binding IclR family transcriptional regulator
MWQVSEQYRGHRQLARLATPVMDRLRTELGDTTRLAQLDGTDNVLIGICESDQPTCVHSAVETWLPADETDFRRCYHASTVRTCPKRTEHAVGGVRSIGGTVLLNGAVISRTKRS